MTKRHWFKLKKFGWIPINLEGWLVVISYLGIVLLTIWESNPQQNLLKDVVVRETPTWLFATLTLLVIIWYKGERPRWKLINIIEKLLS